MCNVYRVSSSVKVKQMEAELTRQLSALRTEIEENGFSRAAGSSSSYRSADHSTRSNVLLIKKLYKCSSQRQNKTDYVKRKKVDKIRKILDN